MTADIIYALFITGIGGLLAFALGLRDWSLPGFGFLLGVSMVSLIGAIQAMTLLSIVPIYSFIIATGISLIACILLREYKTIDRRTLSQQVRLFAATTLSIVVVAWISQIFTYVKHVDSMQYIAIGSMLHSGAFAEEVSIFQLPKRMLTLPALHSPANLVDRYYFKILSPLVALSCLLLVGWFIVQGLRRRVPRPIYICSALLGILILLTTNRFVMHAFYLNNHLLVALLLLAIAGCGWLLSRGPADTAPPLRTLQLMALPPLIFARPEGALLACIAILPSLVSPNVPRSQKAALLIVTGALTVIWQYFLIIFYADAGRTIPFSMRGMLLFGIGLIIMAPLFAWSPVKTFLGRWILLVVESVIWLALAIAAFIQPDVFLSSLSATFQNIVLDEASWGTSLVLLTSLTLIVVVFTRDPDRIYIRFPVTVFVPLSFLLAHLRDAAYRVGDGDSLSRMLIHIVPLAVVFLATSIAADWRRYASSRAPAALDTSA